MKSYIWILSASFFTFTSCSTPSTPKEIDAAAMESIIELTDAQFNNAHLESGKIQQQRISSLLKVNGKIEVPPQNLISISAPMGGYLKSTKLLPGLHIKKGEVIATLEDQQYIQLQQDYLTAQAHYTSIKAEYVRQEKLNESKASSDKVFENARTEYLSQSVLVKSLSEKLKLIGINPDNLTENNISRSISIVSPIDGYVTSVNLNIGKYAAPTDVLFELVDPTDVHLELNVFEKDLAQLSIGQKLFAYSNNDPTKKYNCEIFLIGKNVNKESSTKVHCHFDEYSQDLIPGMYMNAEVEVSGDSAYVISNEGLVRFESKEYVFLDLGNHKYEMKEVQTLNSENGLTQIYFADHTVISDQIFVTKGAYTLLMKMKNTEDE